LFAFAWALVSGFASGPVSAAGVQSPSAQVRLLMREASAVMVEDWLRVPVGPDAGRWVTAPTRRTVLAVVHTVAGAGHLLDAVRLLESDPRVQVVFTQAPDVLSGGVSTLLHELGAVVVPWHQAVRSQFDLALATDAAGLPELRAPVLFLPHGVMNNKRTPADPSGPGSDLVVGLAAPWLTWYGRLVPATVALSHVDLLEVLARQCPQALPVGRVVGDLCLDSLVASRAVRCRYREALGVADGQVVVAVSSTWGPQSLFARFPALPGDLLSALPRARYVVVLGLHPAVWFGHGPRQVLAWLREPRRGGLVVVDPVSWRGVVAAADVVVGDHGSATVYAAAAGVPVLRAPWAADSVAVGSAVATLAERAPVLANASSLRSQVDETMAAFTDRSRRAVAARVTSRPGRAARLLRTQMYALLDLAEPRSTAETARAGLARPVSEGGD
jgi:hypothetical protein